VPALDTAQLRQYEQDGFCVAPGFVDQRSLLAIRASIGAALQQDDAEEPWRRDAARKDGADINGIQRYRKVGQYARHDPALWEAFLTHENVVAVNRQFLGDDVRLWFDSVFTKPAKVGEETPWHQDIGLWTQHAGQKKNMRTYQDALSIWLAVDPSTKVNGCLQFAPGSHRGEVVEHVQYEDAIHCELPRDLVADIEAVHVELQPGDAVIWHAHAWHYSPPNESNENRWGIACVTLGEDAARQAGLTGSPRLIVGGKAQAVGSR
jgi:ectoine hydroxylase-related dioxygenase (phytanoyl-CoA dioxygenase family)